MSNEKIIVNVQFKTSISQDKLTEISNQSLEEMAKIKGLIIKYYHINPETKIVGETYLFENLKLARDYLNNFFLQGIGPKYGIIPETLKMETGIVYMEVKGKSTKHKWKYYNPN